MASLAKGLATAGATAFGGPLAGMTVGGLSSMLGGGNAKDTLQGGMQGLASGQALPPDLDVGQKFGSLLGFAPQQTPAQDTASLLNFLDTIPAQPTSIPAPVPKTQEPLSYFKMRG